MQAAQQQSVNLTAIKSDLCSALYCLRSTSVTRRNPAVSIVRIDTRRRNQKRRNACRRSKTLDLVAGRVAPGAAAPAIAAVPVGADRHSSAGHYCGLGLRLGHHHPARWHQEFRARGGHRQRTRCHDGDHGQPAPLRWHINPAVSFAMFTLRKMSFKHLLLYQWAQYLGGFLGAMVVNLLYFQIFNNLNGGQLVAFGPNGTAGTFFTLPNPAINNGVAFADQVVGTSLLLLAVRAITDPNNLNTPPALQPLLIGLVIMGLIISEVIVSGTCLNPARDFAPRLATLALGYGPEVLSSRSFYFLVPLVGPYVGAVLGAWVYELAYAKPLQLLVEQEAAAALNEDHANDDEDFPTARVQQPHLQQRTPILASATKRRPCDDEDSVKAESLRHAATASLEEKAEC
ncbi:hypothetical protein BOX15_Mlig015833g3 [Macrostomum lignano]|uniref:Aquaporin n=1 Tax=Macrostomum lignano TaxID=282301 RepID=A0A267FT79_9PLAT|nr:hypothetical protein BOX15_Mlig015833g3 [Macrostomum lignano]